MLKYVYDTRFYSIFLIKIFYIMMYKFENQGYKIFLYLIEFFLFLN